MKITLPQVSTAKCAMLGFAFLLLPVYFVAANVLKYELGIPVFASPLEFFYASPELFNVVMPFALLGSLVLTLAINLLPVARFGIRWKGDSIVRTISVKTRWGNLAVVRFSGLLLTTLLGYVVIENIAHYAIGRGLS